MTSPQPSHHRRSFSRRSLRALAPAAAALAALLVARAAYLRGQPDRLFRLGGDMVLTVRDGRAVLLRKEQGAVSLLEQDMTTGRTRTLGREAFGGLDFLDGALDDADYRYTLRPPIRNQQVATNFISFGQKDRDGRVYLGDFRADRPETTGKPGEIRKLFTPRNSPPAAAARIRRLPLTGGPAQELRVPGAGYAGAVADVGSRRYWIVPGDDRMVEVQTRVAKWWEETPRGRLMVSVDGGPPRTLCRAVPSGWPLQQCGDFVSWTDNRSYPNSGRDLYLMRDGMARPVVIEGWRCLGAPVALAGRLYWIDSPAADPMLQLRTRDTAALWSVREDGSGRRLELPLDRPDATPSALFLDHGRIFVVLAHHAPARPAPDPGYYDMPRPDTTWVMRLRTTASVRLDRTAVLPAGAAVCAFDGPFVYYALAERQRGLLELFDDQTQPQSTVWLCRERLRE